MIHIVGDSHAPAIFREAALQKGMVFCSQESAKLIIVAQDMPTDESGKRYPEAIIQLTYLALRNEKATVVLTSQVEPGFTRRFGNERLYHQSETLRIKDALERALNPEQQIVGCMYPDKPLPPIYLEYLLAFGAPIHKMTYEEAEFAKIAINVTLAHQVTLANALSDKAAKLNCRWETIKNVLQHDRRIGKHAYLEPGSWQASPHLLRDYVSFHESL